MYVYRKLTNAERGSLFIVVSDPSVFKGEPHLWSKVSEGGSPIRLKLGKGIAGYVAQSGDSLNVEDAYNDPRFDHTNDDVTGIYICYIESIEIMYIQRCCSYIAIRNLFATIYICLFTYMFYYVRCNHSLVK